MLCCRSAAELRGRNPEDLGRWDTMLSLDNEARCTVSTSVSHVFDAVLSDARCSDARKILATFLSLQRM